MNIYTITQPAKQLGNKIDELIQQNVTYSYIVFGSAFVSLRTVLSLRERLIEQVENVT